MIRYEGLRDLLDRLARAVRHRLWIRRSAVCAIDEHAVEHFADQTKLFSQKKWVPVLFCPKAVRRGTKTLTALASGRRTLTIRPAHAHSGALQR